MHRRLIKQGNGAFTLTLPAKWVKEKKLTKERTISIEEAGNNLIIIPQARPQEKKINIPLENQDNEIYLRTLLSSLYKKGYDKIVFAFSKEIPWTILNKVVGQFMGLDILSSQKKTVEIQIFIEDKKNYIEKLIIKMFQTTYFMGKEVIAKNTHLNFETIQTLKQNVLKTRDHCLRSIQTQKYGNERSYELYDLVTQLEKAATDILSLARYIHDKKIKDFPLFKKDLLFLENIYNAYLSNDFSTCLMIWKKIQNHMGKNKGVLTTIAKLGKKQDNMIIAFHYHFIERLQHISSRVLSLCSTRFIDV